MSRFGTLLQSAAALVLAATSAAHAQSTSLNGKIAYTVCGPSSIPFFPDQCDIWTMNPDGSAQTNLTATTDRNEAGPAWSPDGLRIAYFEGWSDYTLMVMDADGTNAVAHPTTLSFPASAAPTWSPDGTRIAFAARTDKDGPFRIFVAAADGTGLVQLTAHDRGTADRAPVWSPDGMQIAYMSDRNKGFPEILVMNADGTDQRRLTSNAEIDGNPSWSPDGTRLAVERCCVDGSSEIYAIDVATKAATNLTNSTSVNEFDPAWSPDGTAIAYVAVPLGGGNIDIWTMGADGSSPTQITNDPAPDLSPSWQPLPVCTLKGTSGVDELFGTDGDDVICAGAGSDIVHAGFGNDLVFGGTGDDVLEGLDGSDVLYGEGGADTLDGGLGLDVLEGGPGIDVCVPDLEGDVIRTCE